MNKVKANALLVLLGLAVGGEAATGAQRSVAIGFNEGKEPWLARSANVGWVRVDVAWSDVNPSPGVWDFGIPDTRVSEARAYGQQVLGILHYVPTWVGGGTLNNIPPLNTTGWSDFVRRIAQRYAGQIAAYEIWNEPDLSNNPDHGIGWDRNIEEPPLYVDFARAAATEIWSYAPGTLIGGPAFSSRADTPSKQNRRRRILQQIHAAFFPDNYYICIPNSNVFDFMSFHNNGKGTTSSLNTALELKLGSADYVYNYAPCMFLLPVWVTEYGWGSNAVGESGQREKICNITKMYTGKQDAATTQFGDWDIRQAFIFVQKNDATTQSMFRADYSPKPTVTQYLRALPYPATQNPAFSYTEYPTCAGVTSASAAQLGSVGLRQEFVRRGLGDPSTALPRSYRLKRTEVENETVLATFVGPFTDVVQIAVSPLTDEQGVGVMSEGGAEWEVSGVRVSIATPQHVVTPPGLVRKIATAVDPGFGNRCLVETAAADIAAIRRLGLSPPTPPHGFLQQAAALEITQVTKGCGGRQSDPEAFDFTWSFVGPNGATLKAGIYRYGEGFDGDEIGSSSLHWSNRKGVRYWVAMGADSSPELEQSMYEVARSMYPEFSR